VTARYFVDSNILVYARDVTDQAKQERADLWIDWLWQTGTGRLSYQVLLECYSALTRKRRMANDHARTYVETFLFWDPLPIDSNLLELGWEVQSRFGFSWWDSLIIAAAHLSQCDYLLSEDLQPDQDIKGLKVISPFESDPGALQ
jgi:predicted nucleic acid-binding protein